MSKKTQICILGAIILICAMSYYNKLPILLGLEPIIVVYDYSTDNKAMSFKEYPGKGVPFESVLQDFEKFKITSNNNQLKLNRNFKINLLKFWKWKEFLNHPRWKLPYSPQ
jgi:hypothetical protein